MTGRVRRVPGLARLLFPFLPAVLGIGILLAAGALVREYRASVLPLNGISPGFPRAGFPFRVSLPGSSRPGLEPATLLLVKERSGPYFPSLWQNRRTVFEVPIFLEKGTSSAVLGVHDSGVYRFTVLDQKTGNSVLSKQVRVAVPGSFLRNELLLFTLLAISGTIAGRLARKSPFLRGRSWSSPFWILLFWGIMEISVILVFAGMIRPPEADPPALALSQMHPEWQDLSPKNAILTIRRRIMEAGIANWNRFGKEETVFSGQIDVRRSLKKGFLLSPGPGSVTISLVAPEIPGKTLSVFRENLPPSFDPPFPGLLFFGMVLFSGAFFLRSIASP